MKKLPAFLAAVFLFCSCAGLQEAEVEITVDELADLILGSVEFPAMITYTGQSEIEAFLPGADFGAIDEIVFIQQALTVHLIEIVLIKPATREVMDLLLERQNVLKEQLAFYPAQQAAAASSVVSSYNGIAYLICHEEAALIEEIIKA
ncbi:MAG: hypothetical protein FWE74_03070 [Oscillospiraceae bacterium]|nr:hypothetical protein [Oscillospiraceae bacterium]